MGTRYIRYNSASLGNKIHKIHVISFRHLHARVIFSATLWGMIYVVYFCLFVGQDTRCTFSIFSDIFGDKIYVVYFCNSG